MNIYAVPSISERLEGNSYVGRGIVIGKTPDSKKAVFAYFIMGRSQNSRNRVFVKKGDDLFTEPFDASKVVDPSLIIYAAVRTEKERVVVTNGDQTDTVVQEKKKNGSNFYQALETRAFEPDAPNFTPRISGQIVFSDGDFHYDMSILKSVDEKGSDCARFGFSYPSVPGLGHFLHTYVCNGDPIPTFQGEPERVAIPDSIDEFSDLLWKYLDQDNKISLYVRYTDLATKEYQDRLINKNEE